MQQPMIDEAKLPEVKQIICEADSIRQTRVHLQVQKPPVHFRLIMIKNMDNDIFDLFVRQILLLGWTHECTSGSGISARTRPQETLRR